MIGELLGIIAAVSFIILIIEGPEGFI